MISFDEDDGSYRWFEDGKMARDLFLVLLSNLVRLIF